MSLNLGLVRQRSVRLVRQTEVAECGLACLAMIANHHGLDVDLGTLRRQYQPSLRGAALKTLMRVADQMGLTPRAVKLPLEQLGNLHMPAVLHWDLNHFVVIEAVRGQRVMIHNPDGRSKWLSLAEVSKHFTGVAMELRPTDDFVPVTLRQRLRMSQLWSRITGLKRAMLQTVILSLILQAFVVASPYYMQVAVDSALPSLDTDLLTVLAIGFGLFTVINAIASLLRSFVLLSAGAAVGYGVATNIARRLFRLPVAWFEKRHVGDILSRFQSITPIRQFMTEGAVAATLDGGLAIVTFGVMLFYSAWLALIAAVAFGAYALVRVLTFAALRDAQEEAIIMSGREQSTMIESVRGIVTLRLFNRESARHALWQTRLNDATNASIGVSRIVNWQAAANTLIFGCETIASTWVAIRSVIDGGFSVGMVFAFMAYKSQFLQKAASLVDQAIAFRMLDLHLERLSDIALEDCDASFRNTPVNLVKLTGRVELRDVSFRYGPTDPLVLNAVNLVIEPGEHIAITGASGGGKSTLLKILLGLQEPTSGQVLIDGQPLAQFGYKNFHEQIGAVLQEDSLFAGTLGDNIALFDETADQQRIVDAARTAAILDDIAAMPMGFETMVGDMGSALSGGQKQRLLLARALYRAPQMLVMDEGTSHLDPGREQMVNAAVGQLGVTRIVVAHRLETIVAAERIYTLRAGTLEDITAAMAGIKAQVAAAQAQQSGASAGRTTIQHPEPISEAA